MVCATGMKWQTFGWGTWQNRPSRISPYHNDKSTNVRAYFLPDQAYAKFGKCYRRRARHREYMLD